MSVGECNREACLGEATHRSRVGIFDLERGRTETTAVDLTLVAHSLEKPIAFLLPDLLALRGANAEELSDDEKELIYFYRQISSDPMKRYALRQVQQLAQASVEEDQEEARLDAEKAKPVTEKSHSRRNRERRL